MLINQLRDKLLVKNFSANPTLTTYFLLTTSSTEKLFTKAYVTNDLSGQLIAIQLNKKLKNNFSYESFIEEVLEHFRVKLSDDAFVEVIKNIYFVNNEIPSITPLMNMSKPLKLLDAKTKKALNIFKHMMQKVPEELNLKQELNFLEKDIYDIFNNNVIDSQYDLEMNSYNKFLDNIFTKDFIFLLNSHHNFKDKIDKFLKFYMFIYSAQLALNINESKVLDEPTSQELYFILNNEKASFERRKIKDHGYKVLKEKIHYMFPYLSLLESISSGIDDKSLKFFHFNKIEENSTNLQILDELTDKYVEAKSLSPKLRKSLSITEAVNSLLQATIEHFKSGDKPAVISRFVNAFENQIAQSFLKPGGRLGKVLTIDQDTILLLTNLAIGDKGQLRFQELMDEFRARSVYFDPKSEDVLLELYERVGNVDRKSDSGDAVYVKAI